MDTLLPGLMPQRRGAGAPVRGDAEERAPPMWAGDWDMA